MHNAGKDPVSFQPKFAAMKSPGRLKSCAFLCLRSFGETNCISLIRYWRPRRDLNPCYRRESSALSRHSQEVSGIDGHRKESAVRVGSRYCGGVVQLARTPACHAGGRGFESRRSRHSTRKAVLGATTPGSFGLSDYVRFADQQARMRRLATGPGSTVALVANESINQHFKSHAENFCRW